MTRSVAVLADKVYQAAGSTIAVPFKGKHLSDNQKAANRSLAKARASVNEPTPPSSAGRS